MNLFQYQLQGVERIEALKGRALLADQPGLGKTVQAIEYMRRHPEAGPMLIVCPAMLKYHWRREAEAHCGMEVEVLGSKTPRRLAQRGVYAINYDVLEAWLDELIAARFGLIVHDECHAYRGRDTARTKAAFALTRDVERLIFISGTPIVNRPAEFWPTLHMLDRKRFPAFHPFGHRFCAPRRTPWGWNFGGASRTEELHKILTDDYMIRRLKSDVMGELPPKMRHVVRLRLPPKAAAEYNECRKDVVAWLKKNYRPGAAASASKGEALAKINVLRQLTARLKMPLVNGWVDEFLESGEKLIVFAWHRHAVGGLKRDGCALVCGDTAGEERDRQVTRFRNDPDCRLFVGNIRAAGTGWSANSCSDVAFAEFAWTPGDHEQCEDRAHGQFRGREGVTTTAYYLVAEGTIDTMMCGKIRKKQGVLDSVVDGREQEGGFDVLDEVIEDLTEGR